MVITPVSAGHWPVYRHVRAVVCLRRPFLRVLCNVGHPLPSFLLTREAVLVRFTERSRPSLAYAARVLPHNPYGPSFFNLAVPNPVGLTRVIPRRGRGPSTSIRPPLRLYRPSLAPDLFFCASRGAANSWLSEWGIVLGYYARRGGRLNTCGGCLGWQSPRIVALLVPRRKVRQFILDKQRDRA